MDVKWNNPQSDFFSRFMVFCRMDQPVISVCSNLDFIMNAFKNNRRNTSMIKSIERIGNDKVFRTDNDVYRPIAAKAGIYAF